MDQGKELEGYDVDPENPFMRNFYIVRETGVKALGDGSGPEHPPYINERSRISVEPQRKKPEIEECGEDAEIIEKRLPQEVEESEFEDVLVRTYETPGSGKIEPDGLSEPELNDIRRNVRKAYQEISKEYPVLEKNEIKRLEDLDSGDVIVTDGGNLLYYGFRYANRGAPPFRLRLLTSKNYKSDEESFFGEKYSSRDLNQKNLFSENEGHPTAFEKFFQELLEDIQLKEAGEAIEKSGTEMRDTAKEGLLMEYQGKSSSIQAWIEETQVNRDHPLKMDRTGILIY